MHNNRDDDKITILTNKMHSLDKRVTHIEIDSKSKNKTNEKDIESINTEISSLKKSKVTLFDKVAELHSTINKYGWQISLLWLGAGFIIVTIMSSVIK